MVFSLLSAAATSKELILTFSDDIQIAGGSTINPAYLTVIIDGQPRKVTSAQIDGSKLTLSLRSRNRASSFSISNNPPSDGSNQGFIIDPSGNPLAVSTQVVDTFSTSTNISTGGIPRAFKNLILTGSEPITAYGNIHNNIITGNDANNFIDGLDGADNMIGGLGDDTYVVDNVGDVIAELELAGTDTVKSKISYTLTDNVENLTLLGYSSINGTGNTADNILTGNAAANILNGNGGTDTLIGGQGNDTYIVDSEDDIITETGSPIEIDSAQSSVSWVLGTNLENLTLTGTNSINGTGNALNNTIIGNSAINILNGGGGGTDRLTGLGGSDYFQFSTLPSSFSLSQSTADHITDFSRAQGDKIQISKSAFGITTSTATLSVVSRSNTLSNALTTEAMFVYDPMRGDLYWNQDGISRGAGSGGVLAILDNKASLRAEDLVLI